MNSYILSNTKKSKKVLLYQEKESYNFTPKKNFCKIKSITILDESMLDNILKSKVIKKYNHLIKIIYSLLSDGEVSGGDALICFKEIDRIREYLASLKDKLPKSFIELYLKKVYLLEMKLGRVPVMLEPSYEEEKSRGGR